jgi:hypothetical protein
VDKEGAGRAYINISLGGIENHIPYACVKQNGFSIQCKKTMFMFLLLGVGALLMILDNRVVV